jgi:glycosyltransferase involved in cell wall biosynthesis
MTPETDIIISTRITREFPNEAEFAQCIQAVADNTSRYRLILVDDGSDGVGQEIVSNIAKRFRDCILIRTHFQHWFTRAFNLGLRMARTPHVVLLNSDTIPRQGWLEELYAVQAEAEGQIGRVGIVGSVLSGDEPRRWANAPNPDYVTGHCWLASMQALAEISNARGMPGIYLDETCASSIHINSDVKACTEMNNLGWSTVKSFKSHVDHHGGKAWGHQVWRIAHLKMHDVAYHYAGETI